MSEVLATHTRRRLHIQGFHCVADADLAPVARWLRLSFLLCAMLAGLGTTLRSPGMLVTLAVIAAAGAASPVHPLDLIYNLGIRHLTGTGPLPKRGAPSRFACGMGAVMLLITAGVFVAGYSLGGLVLGGTLTAVALLVSTTDICLPSMLYRSIFGWPPLNASQAGEGRV